MRKILFFLSLMIGTLEAKEMFTSNKIAEYLNDENPYIYTAHAQEYIYKAKEQYQLGEFDTKFSVKYDKKEYPVTKGEFYEASLSKPVENGMEFIAGYRQAEGTQEYNNIKTSQNGEMIAGVNIPVFSLIHKTNTRKMNLKIAQIQSIKYRFNTQNVLRVLYTEILTSYYELLYNKALVKLETELLEYSEKRESFIRKKIDSGTAAEIELIEIQQQIINRKQRLLSAKNDYEKSLELFLRYLNISTEVFFSKYVLEDVLETETIHVTLSDSIEMAINSRVDLKMLQYEKEKLELEKKNTVLSGYPNLNLSVYGVHDFTYNEGFKVSVDMVFPIERRKYYGKTQEIDKTVKYIEKLKEKKVINIKTRLANIINSLKAVEKNILYAGSEVKLAQKLRSVEYTKYNIGTSNLFMINQREIYSLEVKKKILKYKLDYLRLKEQFHNEVGMERNFGNI